MLKKQIERFITKVRNDDKLFVFVKFVSSKHLEKDIEAQTHIYADNKKHIVGCVMELSRSVFLTNDINLQKGILLHELGHLYTSVGKSSPINEYRAHEWAINKAEQIGLIKTAKYLRLHIDSWQYVPWNEGRLYRLAYHIAKRKKLL
jgi:hypothetical protein